MPSIISVDELCQAAESTLKDLLPQVLQIPAMADLIREPSAPYVVKTWQQLPVVEAIATADLPGVAITSAGLVEEPTYSRANQAWDTTWRIAVGIYDRGVDHEDTQARVRNWAALIRTSLQLAPTLGGVAQGLTWSGEQYALLPNRNQARTAAAGAVAFDVKASVRKLTLGPGIPSVTSVHPTLSVE